MIKVFITYSWDDTEHQNKVISFTDFLRRSGFNAVVDKLLTQEETAIDFMKMMHQNMYGSDKVIIILSKGYKEKAENFIGGVGEEYQFILKDIHLNLNKYILVSFDGVKDEIIPSGLKNREVINLFKDENNNYALLFSKLSDVALYEFSEVSENRPIISVNKISEFSLKEKIPLKRNEEDFIEDGVFQNKQGEYKIIINSSDFFYNRLVRAFPGIRGLKIFSDPKICVDRLLLLFRDPIVFDYTELQGNSHPLWWFRDGSNMYIKKADRLADNKMLLDYHELLIKKIGVYNSGEYGKSFVYVEMSEEKQTGINHISEQYINTCIWEQKRLSEEYAIFNDKLITREEFDDSAAEIEGEIVDVFGAKLRVRYLTPYNFVITGQESAINSTTFDIMSKEIFNGILASTHKIEDLCDLIEELPMFGRYNS
ncbi:MAG: hypothetical protein JWQ38_541 [Flavipsychrobacter sp.]|nr:hypothetical protein [Flavipsychrobacter sp.]